MKITLGLIFLLLVSACSTTKPVVTVSGINRIKYGDPKYELVGRAYDNLSENVMSEILLDYYHSLDLKAFKSIEIRVDTTAKELDFYPATAFSFSKKAKDGYLFVNKSIMEKVASLGCDLDELKVSYVYNNRIVTTKEDVMRVLGLRERRIRISEILQDEQAGVMTVYIFDK